MSNSQQQGDGIIAAVFFAAEREIDRVNCRSESGSSQCPPPESEFAPEFLRQQRRLPPTRPCWYQQPCPPECGARPSTGARQCAPVLKLRRHSGRGQCGVCDCFVRKGQRLAPEKGESHMRGLAIVCAWFSKVYLTKE